MLLQPGRLDLITVSGRELARDHYLESSGIPHGANFDPRVIG